MAPPERCRAAPAALQKISGKHHGSPGGYRLTRSPEDYPVGEILRAVEGNLSPIACQSEDGCGASCDCDARLFWQGLEDQINSYVDNHTLAQFMRVNEKTPAVLNGTERR